MLHSACRGCSRLGGARTWQRRVGRGMSDDGWCRVREEAIIRPAYACTPARRDVKMHGSRSVEPVAGGWQYAFVLAGEPAAACARAGHQQNGVGRW